MVQSDRLSVTRQLQIRVAWANCPMVSSRRQVTSPTSSCSSYSDSRKQCQDYEPTFADRKRDRGNEETFFNDDREVARRVLEDLDSLYFDGSDDEESEDEDERDSKSEWGSDLSSCSSRGSRKTGGMTLEELTMAVNAAIEYHRPTKPIVAVKTSKGKADEVRQKLDEQHSHHCCHQRKSYFNGSSLQTGESVMEMFQDMLERKEKQFYTLRATQIPAHVEIRDNQYRGAAPNCVVTVNQHQQTTSYVRDQATETEEFAHHPLLDESVAEIDTPVESRSPDVAPYELMKPITGPTVADLAYSHRRIERYPSSFQSYHALETSRSSSSPSPTNDPAIMQLSSFGSEFSASRGSSCSSRSSTKSATSNQHSSPTSKRGRGSSRTTNKVSSSSVSSKHTSHRRISQESSIKTTHPNTCELTLTNKDHAEEFSQVGVASLPSDPPQVPSRPELVAWELDLSNFSF